jgi:hypothetical protein
VFTTDVGNGDSQSAFGGAHRSNFGQVLACVNPTHPSILARTCHQAIAIPVFPPPSGRQPLATRLLASRQVMLDHNGHPDGLYPPTHRPPNPQPVPEKPANFPSPQTPTQQQLTKSRPQLAPHKTHLSITPNSLPTNNLTYFWTNRPTPSAATGTRTSSHRTPLGSANGVWQVCLARWLGKLYNLGKY